MPTTDIIGYLWTERQHLDLDGLPDVLQMVHDLAEAGLPVVILDEHKVLGLVIGTTARLVRRTPAEWSNLVEKAIIDASLQGIEDMVHQGGDDE